MYVGDTGAFYFDDISAEDGKLFLLKQTCKPLLLLLSETMDIFLLAVPSKPGSQPIWLKD